MRLVGLVLTLMACGESQQDDVTRVESDDGSASLHISDGALPDGVQASDITIVRDDARLGLAGSRLWTLEPDGLEFSAPVELRLAVEISPGEFFSVVHLSHADQQAEDLSEALLATDNDEGVLTELTVPISHFSDVAVIMAGSATTGTAEARWAPQPNDSVLQGPVLAGVEVSVPETVSTAHSTGEGFWIEEVIYDFAASDGWLLSTRWRSSGLSMASDSTDSFTDLSGTVTQSFVCEEPEFELNASTRVRMTGRSRFLTSSGAVVEGVVAIASLRSTAGGVCPEPGSSLTAEDPTGDWGETCAGLEAGPGPDEMDIVSLHVAELGDVITAVITFNGDNKAFLEAQDEKPDVSLQFQYGSSGYLEVILQPDCTVKVVDNKADGSVEWLNDGKSMQVTLGDAPFGVADLERVVANAFRYDSLHGTYCDDAEVP